MTNDPFQLGGTPLYSPVLKSRAITMENKTGEKGRGGMEGGGRKGAACLPNLEKDQEFTFAEIDGPGAIRHIWITVENKGPFKMRNLILRFYWDGQETPSVEAPLTDFFGVCHGLTRPFESEFLVMPEGAGFNSYFLMPFGRKARLTIANETGQDAGMFFFQVDYTLGDPVTEETPRFHAQFRRTARTTMREDFVILDGVQGRGRYLGATIGVIDLVPGNSTWWGEGEVKIFLDGDTQYPTICGTGAEDYVGSGWGLGEFACREMGAPVSNNGFISMYRFHARDPIYFSEDVKVTLQQLGNDATHGDADPWGVMGEFRALGKYHKEHPDGYFEREDDVCSTAYWYQTLPTQPFPVLPDRALRSVNLSRALDLVHRPPRG
ncbi:MAG: hypothetical protein PWP23_2665 [Candidatus Sumerlaeota bacterium]|nr:hypothetical protein [Candidatus Sumerlaeota bacterium]